MTTVLAIDPGIINLSFCLKKQEEILFWKTINITDEKKECSGFLKNGKKCSFKPLYISELSGLSGISAHYCKRHKESKGSVLIKKKNSKYMDYGDIVKCVFKAIDEVKENIDIPDYIIIENQRKSTERIKFVAACIFTYMSSLYPDTRIQFINAYYKLSICDEHIINSITRPKSKYAYNKKLSKKQCEYMIEDDEQWSEVYKSCSKKDDLADTFLLSTFFIRNNFKTTIGKRKTLKSKKKKQ